MLSDRYVYTLFQVSTTHFSLSFVSLYFRRFLAQLNQRRVEIETFRLSFVCQMLTTIRQFL